MKKKVWTVLAKKNGSNYRFIAKVYLTHAEARADCDEFWSLFSKFTHTIRSAKLTLDKARKVK